MNALRPQRPWLCGCSRLSRSARSVWHCRGQYLPPNTNKGLNVAKHQHETIIDRMNAALASEQAQQIGIPYRKNPNTLIRDVSSLKTLSLSFMRKISKRPTPQHFVCPRLSFPDGYHSLTREKLRLNGKGSYVMSVADLHSAGFLPHMSATVDPFSTATIVGYDVLCPCLRNFRHARTAAIMIRWIRIESQVPACTTLNLPC